MNLRRQIISVPVSAILLAAILFTDIRPAAAAEPAAIDHNPAKATSYLDVGEGMEVTLFCSEPLMTNPTNIDIDPQGRVWVCDVQNYRGHNGLRPAGDRILILEDTSGGGKADKVTTFYQGRDIDSAMGVCVLGARVIVSCSPNIWSFTDDGTGKAVKKEAIFIKTGASQHDHSAHKFVFGPDGKLYWNFGNQGYSVADKLGRPVVDLEGNVVNDSGKPYREGMVFRCDMDGGNFEVLAHNFRNNYEVCVDSFGTMWQSDNDDDGNRGTRINYVMEHGNYGYTDEMTGAAWQTPYLGQSAEIPKRHWHLTDPGVVPNLLQTGAVSPAGILLNEGNLLPAVFHNQIIHADPLPNVVRAYPAINDSAGYSARVVNILSSERNHWFRPVDVCIAPDGSLFVADWYDPGVGGHAQADTDRGRIFRVAPKGKRYVVPKFDFTTIDGAIEALKNPCLSVRYMAWTKLHEAGAACRNRQAESNPFDANRIDRHQAQSKRVLRDRHDGAPDEGARQDQLQHCDHEQRNHAWHHDPQRNTDRAEVQGWADIRRLDIAIIDAKIEDQRDFGDEQQAEKEGEAAQRFLASLLERLIVDLINSGAEHEECRRHDNGGQNRIEAEIGVDDIGDVGPENNESRVCNVDDVENAERYRHA